MFEFLDAFPDDPLENCLFIFHAFSFPKYLFAVAWTNSHNRY